MSKRMSYKRLSEIRVDPSSVNEEDMHVINSQPQEVEMDEILLQKNGRSSWLSSIMKEEVKAVKNNQPLGPKIPKVGDELKNENEECYDPLAVSIGPYHYLDRHDKLSEVEILKVPMARQFIMDSKKDIELLYNEVKKVIPNAREFYDERFIGGFDEEQFTHMMFLDGCFVLQFINSVMSSNYENLRMSDQQVADVKRDLLLLENQLPFQVLKSLMRLRYEEEDDDGMKLTYDFLSSQILQPTDQPLWTKLLLWPGVLWLLLLLLPIDLILFISVSAGSSQPSYQYYSNSSSSAFGGHQYYSNSSSSAYASKSPSWGRIGGILLVIISAFLTLIWLLRLLRFLLLLPFTKKTQFSGFDWQRRPDRPYHLLECLYFVCLGKGRKKQSQGRGGHFMSSYLVKFLEKFKPPVAPAARSRGHYLYYSAKDLKKVGIHFMPSPTCALKDVKFKSSLFYGTLKLPSITIDVSTKSILFNLVAYETCATTSTRGGSGDDDDDQLWVTSYIFFMDSLINDAEDVKELRSKGILINYLGFDQQVADLFNHMGSTLKLDTNAYNDVKKQINKQSESSLKKWVAQWQQTYFSSPWAFIAFAAAASGLALTATQTYFTIHPSDKSQPPIVVMQGNYTYQPPS